MAEEAKESEVSEPEKEVTTITSSVEIPASYDDMDMDSLKKLHGKISEAFNDKKGGTAGDKLEALKLAEEAKKISELVAAIQSLSDEVQALPTLEVEEVKPEAEVTTEVETEAPTASVETEPEAEVPVAENVELPAPEKELVTASAEVPSERVETEVRKASAVYTASAASEGQFTIGQTIGFSDIQELLNDVTKGGVQQTTRVANLGFEGIPVIDLRKGDIEGNTAKLLAAHLPGQTSSPTAKAMGFDDSIQARTAAWGCDPIEVSRDIVSCVTFGRPLAQEFPTLLANRLSVKFAGKGTFNIGGTATTGTNLVTSRTSGSTAIQYGTSSTWKTILDYTCGTEQTLEPQEIIAAVRFTEQQQFSGPEQVAEAINRINAQMEINAERALATTLDTKLTQHTASLSLGASSLSRAIANEIWQIEQTGNYTDMSGYIVTIPAGLINLMYADIAGREGAPQDVKKFADDLIGVHGLRTVITRGGTDPALTITAQSNGAIPALPTVWYLRIFNPDNFRLARHAQNQYSVEAVPRDLNQLLTNSSAFFGRFYEGLADLGNCAQARLAVTLTLDSASRVAAATTV